MGPRPARVVQPSFLSSNRKPPQSNHKHTNNSCFLTTSTKTFTKTYSTKNHAPQITHYSQTPSLSFSLLLPGSSNPPAVHHQGTGSSQERSARSDPSGPGGRVLTSSAVTVEPRKPTRKAPGRCPGSWWCKSLAIVEFKNLDVLLPAVLLAAVGLVIQECGKHIEEIIGQ